MDLAAEIRKHRPFFADQRILFLEPDKLASIEPFIAETTWEDNGSINVFMVAGTTHLDYRDMTWLEFLDKGEKMDINLKLFRSNPDYYLGLDHKLPTMSYIQIDGGPLYVGADGNHRTCIAKAYFFLKGLSMLHGVTITHHRLDHKAMELHQRLLNRFRSVRAFRTKVKREDSGGWMREVFETSFEITDRKGHVSVFSKSRPEELLNRGILAFFRRLKFF